MSIISRFLEESNPNTEPNEDSIMRLHIEMRDQQQEAAKQNLPRQWTSARPL